MGGTRGFRTHEGILADVLVTAWILSIGMAAVAAVAAVGHWEVALVLGVLFTLNVWLVVGTARSDARDIAMLRGLVTDQVKEGCMCRDRQQLVKAGAGWMTSLAPPAAAFGRDVQGLVAIAAQMAELSQLHAWTFGPIGPTPGRIKAAVRKLQREGKCDLVVVDYLQLLTCETRPEQRHLEIGQYSRAFKWLALEFRIPVIVLSQLSRSAESTSDKRPTLQHLRESGNIEQDADVVMFLWREDYYKPETERKGITECIIAKQRHGPVGTVELRWNPEYVSFENLAKGVPA